MALDLEQVRWVSHLARLDLSAADMAILGKKLGAVLEYVDQLKQVDTEGVEPMAHPLPMSNVFRADEPAASLTADEALANAPVRHGNFFGVPAVFE